MACSLAYPHKPMMRIAYSPIFSQKLKKFLYFCEIDVFCLIYSFCFSHFDHDEFMHHALHALDASGTMVLYLLDVPGLFVLHFVWREAATLGGRRGKMGPWGKKNFSISR